MVVKEKELLVDENPKQPSQSNGDSSNQANDDLIPYMNTIYNPNASLPPLTSPKKTDKTPKSEEEGRLLGSNKEEGEEEGEEAVATLSTFEAGLAFLKSNWGIGFLGTPFAFRKAGIIGGVIGYVGLTALVVFTTRLLIKCKEELRQQGVKVSTLSDISRTILGLRADFAVTTMVVISQVGDCVLYVIYIARSFEALFQPRAVGGFYYTIVAACTIPVLLPIVLIRRMKMLMKVVYGAILFMTVSVITIIVYGIQHSTSCIDPVTEFEMVCRVRFWDLDNLPVFLGIVSFGLEGIQNVMPIHEAMRKPEDFNKMLYLVYAALSVIYVSFGVGVYTMFADVTQSVISLNITGKMGIVVKVLLSVMLLCTFPIQMFPVAHIIDHKFKWHADDKRSVRNSRLARTGLLLVSVGMAMGIPYFGNLLSLIGCTCVSLLGFFLPSTLYLKNFRGTVVAGEYIACGICIVCSLGVFVSGFIVNIRALINHPS